MTRSGRVYYSKGYTAFKGAANRAMPAVLMDAGLLRKLTGPLLVNLVLRVARPKRTKLQFPKPDIDNYAKSVLDALNGHAWLDDDQVIGLVAHKEWADFEESGEILISIQNYGEGLQT